MYEYSTLSLCLSIRLCNYVSQAPKRLYIPRRKKKPYIPPTITKVHCQSLEARYNRRGIIQIASGAKQDRRNERVSCLPRQRILSLISNLSLSARAKSRIAVTSYNRTRLSSLHSRAIITDSRCHLPAAFSIVLACTSRRDFTPGNRHRADLTSWSGRNNDALLPLPIYARALVAAVEQYYLYADPEFGAHCIRLITLLTDARARFITNAIIDQSLAPRRFFFFFVSFMRAIGKIARQSECARTRDFTLAGLTTI